MRYPTVGLALTALCCVSGLSCSRAGEGPLAPRSAGPAPARSAIGPPARSADSAAHTEWVETALKRMQTVRPGMTRGDLLKVFNDEGGISTREQRTYAYQDCPYFKVDVKFKAVKASPAPKGPGPHESPADVIISISQPYLNWSVMD